MRNSDRTIARNLTLIENRHQGFKELIDSIYPKVGKAWRLGITGPPGAGKSSLINRLIDLFRRAEQRVAVLAIDPSSPFKGGAFLGDRIRMDQWAENTEVFIRSCASRGSDGGLSAQASLMSDYLDSEGFDVVITETLGVGQAEIDVSRSADTVLVVLTPQSGDGIQALKTGLMEIAHIFAVNKSDQEGAEELVHSLRTAIDLRSPEAEKPIVIKVSATSQELPDQLFLELTTHRDRIQQTGQWKDKRSARRSSLIQLIVREELERRFWHESKISDLDQLLESNETQEQGPFALASKILGN